MATLNNMPRSLEKGGCRRIKGFVALNKPSRLVMHGFLTSAHFKVGFVFIWAKKGDVYEETIWSVNFHSSC